MPFPDPERREAEPQAPAPAKPPLHPGGQAPQPLHPQALPGSSAEPPPPAERNALDRHASDRNPVTRNPADRNAVERNPVERNPVERNAVDPLDRGRPDPWRAGQDRSALASCRDSIGANTDLIRLVAAAADLCRKPLRHGVVVQGDGASLDLEALEATLRLEARDPEGVRCPQEDLELELYRSGGELNLTLAWLQDEQRPMLWQGSHPVWMDGSGCRCSAPVEGAPLEALARRLRSLLVARC